MRTTEGFPHESFYLYDTEIHVHTANSKNHLYLECHILQYYYKSNKQTKQNKIKRILRYVLYVICHSLRVPSLFYLRSCDSKAKSSITEEKETSVRDYFLCTFVSKLAEEHRWTSPGESWSKMETTCNGTLLDLGGDYPRFM